MPLGPEMNKWEYPGYGKTKHLSLLHEKDHTVHLSWSVVTLQMFLHQTFNEHLLCASTTRVTKETVANKAGPDLLALEIKQDNGYGTKQQTSKKTINNNNKKKPT